MKHLKKLYLKKKRKKEEIFEKYEHITLERRPDELVSTIRLKKLSINKFCSAERKN